MSKHVVIGVIVIVLVGLGVWVLMSHNEVVAPTSLSDGASPGSSKTVTVNQAASISETFSGSGSFNDLADLGRSLECTFQSVSQNTKGAVVGTVWVANGRLRADFQMQQAGHTYN